MTQDAPSTTWLSQEAYDRLTAELNHLVNVGRREIAATIEAAREEGDLKENAGYHAAKDEQALIEARIRSLQSLLEHAVVGEAAPSDGTVRQGMVVTVKVHGEETTFLLGSRELAGETDIEILSDQSPLGAALIGAKVGEAGSYVGNSGREVAFEVISAEPFQG